MRELLRSRVTFLSGRIVDGSVWWVNWEQWGPETPQPWVPAPRQCRTICNWHQIETPDCHPWGESEKERNRGVWITRWQDQWGTCYCDGYELNLSLLCCVSSFFFLFHLFVFLSSKSLYYSLSFIIFQYNSLSSSPVSVYSFPLTPCHLIMHTLNLPPALFYLFSSLFLSLSLALLFWLLFIPFVISWPIDWGK